MKIKKAKSKDIPQLIKIERTSFTNPYNKKQITRALKKYNNLIFKSKEGILGYVIFEKKEPSWIRRIAVSPGFRRRGIGKKLMEEVIKFGVKNKISKINLHVRVSNPEGLAFYQKLGFKIVGVDKKYYSNSEDALKMEKIL